jgi:hypothetical protein
MDQSMIVRTLKPLQRGLIAARYCFEFIHRHTSTFGTVLIVHILQESVLALCSVGCLVRRINIHSLVPVSKRSQLAGRIEDVCGNEKNTRC